MQIFIVGSPLETAQVLDPRRLNKQVIETVQIVKTIIGESDAWKNHPVVKMYTAHWDWLILYKETLKSFLNGDLDNAKFLSKEADRYRPDFHIQAFFDQMKRRLYTKDNNYYSQWSYLGKSNVNWYYVSGNWIYYENGKRL